MWSTLPSDPLSVIFSYLSPDCLARAKSVCKNWCACANSAAAAPPPVGRRSQPPWFIALPTRFQKLICYAHNPLHNYWHTLPLDFIPYPFRPVASPGGGLVLLRLASSTTLQLAICNPFTRQLRHLPMLNTARTNPAVGVIESPNSSYRIYVAGGMSEAASYVPTLEMYESGGDKWRVIGAMPMEYAVRLTVWTANESVHSNGVLYWITSARAYSIMGFEVETKKWRQLSVPMVDRLEFAALLVTRKGQLRVVGGGGGVWVWELGEDDKWSVIETVPLELGMRLLGGNGSWGNVKCVGGIDGGAVYLYRDVGEGMVVWRGCVENGGWQWCWVEGCSSVRENQLHNFPIKGLLLHPNLGLCA
nr:F-box protein At5g49610-like [Ipomoea batatas]